MGEDLQSEFRHKETHPEHDSLPFLMIHSDQIIQARHHYTQVEVDGQIL